MPVLQTNLDAPALLAHQQLSYEQLLSAWFTRFGWEVLKPMVDHGRRTDLVVADDAGRYFRIQVKTVQSRDEGCRIEKRWHGARLDYIVIFSATADWGYIAPAFTEGSRRVNDRRHVRFAQNPHAFMTAFGRV